MIVLLVLEKKNVCVLSAFGLTGYVNIKFELGCELSYAGQGKRQRLGGC